MFFTPLPEIFTTAQEIWLRSLRILARFGVEVHVSSATVTWLATQSASWFHRWNGNSPSLKLMQGSVQPAQGCSFVLQERYVDMVISGRPYGMASVGIKVQGDFYR